MQLKMSKQNFEIDNNIYPENLILIAIQDFSEVAEITYENNNLIIKSDWNEIEIFNEFVNYVTWLYNELN